ncbi:hypothetical protein PsYK624_027130 [Phanerochaete sordida]|uniref:Uncharacterized protein n=1 Tax=Phanerochaete sordida TaxID=48140 RepID=A0A9P3G1P3_9APHY|nr:hypothetical protein PsYK624_027130 [Phanerochaete sordida]
MAFTVLSSPTTPSARHGYDQTWAHIPSNSSPLASSEAGSSPTQSPSLHASERRRAQYKSFGGDADSPTASRRRPSRRIATGTIPFSLSPNAVAGPSQEPTRTTMLRERFKARCIERANEERRRRINGKRTDIDLSSDGADEFMDDEDDEEAVLDDPFFQRIMANLKSKEKYSYRVSYAHDVGESFDPDMENMDEWLNDGSEEVHAGRLPDEEELDDEILAQLAAERDLLDGLNMDEVFSYSDVEDYPTQDEDVEMD